MHTAAALPLMAASSGAAVVSANDAISNEDGTGLATSGVTTLLANSERDDCPNNECDTAEQKDAYDRLRLVSTVSFWSGAALLTGGIVTWLVASGGSEKKPEPGLVTKNASCDTMLMQCVAEWSLAGGPST